MKASVTVLIPAHGNSPYLRETLRSIELNTVLPKEVLIVDDGLTKSACESIDSFQNCLPIIVAKNNGSGLVDALNTGLEIASGEFICRIDGDDLMFPNRIEKQLKLLQSNHQLVAIGSQCIYIDKDSVEIGHSQYPVGVINKNPEFQLKCLIAHPSTMYHLDSALLIGGYRSLFKWNGTDIAEDFDFWLRLSDKGQILISEEILTKYRQHKEQISSNSLYGQLLGTPYISAVNKQDQNVDQIKIEFTHNRSPMLLEYFRILKAHMGRNTYLAARLTLFGLSHPYWFGNGIPRRILLRIISSLNA